MKSKVLNNKWASLALVIASACVSGCQSPRVQSSASKRMEIQRNVIGKSVENRPIFCEIFSDGGHSSGTVLILASIHGNEHVGTPLLQILADYLRDHPEILAGRRVILVPEANPDGAFHQQRHNAHGIDLNRNFPAKNWSDQTDHGAKPLSEPESRALHALINKYNPNRIVTLHQPLNCMDYDGPAAAKALAETMSEKCDLQVKKVGALDGSLGSFAGEALHIPIITVEFDAELSNASKEELWQRYGTMLLTAICF